MNTAFPPIAQPDAKILILGSMPSVASLQAQQYYAHPRNAFWRIMGALFGAGPELDYAARVDLLKGRGIAVWDVIHACRRDGSLDSAIDEASLVPNDFAGFFSRHRQVRALFFNGKSVARLIRMHVQKQQQIMALLDGYHVLPSTSPANARLDWQAKLAHWRALLRFLPSN